MNHFRCQAFALFALCVASAWAQAETSNPIRFVRTPDVSPDGKLVVFSYLGDLWIVDAAGGVARHLTMHESIISLPFFSVLMPRGLRFSRIGMAPMMSSSCRCKEAGRRG